VVRGEHHALAQHPACRRDVLRARIAEHRIMVPIAPVKGMHGKQRRENAQLLELAHLVAPQRLSVDQHRAYGTRLLHGPLARTAAMN
jgi:hypothetical protein